MKPMTITAVLLALVFAAGCRNETSMTEPVDRSAPATAAARDLTPEQLGELGARIEKEPERASDLLDEHGLDEERFEREIRKVTESPEASRRYAEAYRKARA